MDDVCPLTDERKQLDVDALVFDREDLVEDEGLAQAREAGHDVRDLQSSQRRMPVSSDSVGTRRDLAGGFGC
jgi:hypothetical protein